MPICKCISLSTMSPCPVPSECVICLGNFDGVHIAHRKLLQTAKALRNNRFPKAFCGVFCFEKPSSDYLAPDHVAHLSTLSQKLEYFREEGMEYVFLADFPSIRTMPPQEFVKSVLLDLCHCTAAVCGFNYRFGKNGGGDPDLLKDTLGKPVLICEEVTENGETVSSTHIRHLLWDGKTEEANKLLGRPYSFCSKVIHGKALGKKMGTPTINQAIPQNMLIPRHGVYVTDCLVGDQILRGITNIGVHPTVDTDAAVNCETYLLDFSGDLYESEIQVSFLKFLRPETKFDSLEDLKEQIQKDILAAKQYTKT